MKNNKGNTVRLGMFVSIGVLLLVLGIYFIGKKQQLFSSTFNLNGVFKDISGLQVGDNVRFGGINVGVVENIEIIADTSVRVDFNVAEKVRKFISKDARATIGSDGLMGNKILIIAPGSGKGEIQNNDHLATYIPVNIDDILSKLKTTSDNAATISDDLSVIMNSIRSGKGVIGKLFMDSTMANNLDQTIVNIKQGAGGFKQDVDAAKHNFLLRGYFKKKKENEEKKKEDKNQNDKKQ